jgi:hypothetical protein
MAVLCLLTNTPWPWPTPAEAASARGGFPTLGTQWRGRNEAEVCTSEARKIRAPLSAGLVSLALRGAHECTWGGRCAKERPAEEGIGRRQRDRPLETGEKRRSLYLVDLLSLLLFFNTLSKSETWQKWERDLSGHITRARGASICVFWVDFDSILHNYGRNRKSWILM